MDIGSKHDYPAGALLNFSPHLFIIDEVDRSSKNWKKTQTLYWRGTIYRRDSKEYQELLDRAYEALSKNDGFRRALLASGN